MSSTQPAALDLRNVGFRYGARVALEGVSLQLPEAGVMGLLGPNGGGKSTLFRLITTLLKPATGSIAVFGEDTVAQPQRVRHLLGVTFQSPSLDGRLSVQENLRHQGHLYGLYGSGLKQRMTTLSEQLGIVDRWKDVVDTLSGGLKRRVELAKCLLHGPRLLILDEPSTGLDPGGRLDLWELLSRLRRESGLTIFVTTHLMDEAERCDEVAILNRGKLVAQGTPARLRSEVGGDAITIQAKDLAGLASAIQARFGMTPRTMSDGLRIEHPQAPELVRDLATVFAEQIESISLAKPTLEDVFIRRTGHRFWDQATTASG